VWVERGAPADQRLAAQPGQLFTQLGVGVDQQRVHLVIELTSVIGFANLTLTAWRLALTADPWPA
jgi:hypothetical protein